MCWRWEWVTLVPGALAWFLLLATAVVAVSSGASLLARIGAIACVATGLITFMIAAGLGVGCDRQKYAWSGYRAGRELDRMKAVELRLKLHLGATMGALPALGGAALLGLNLRRRRRET